MIVICRQKKMKYYQLEQTEIRIKLLAHHRESFRKLLNEILKMLSLLHVVHKQKPIHQTNQTETIQIQYKKMWTKK